MARITDYETLQTEVADWLNRGDLTDQIPGFIQLGEQTLRRKVRGAYTETGILALDDGLVGLPADTGTVEHVLVESNGRTYPLTQVPLAELILKRGAVTGRPSYYAVVENDLWLGPTPDQTYSATVVYEPWLDLSTTQTTNWLFDTAPDAYLFAALLAAAPYLKDDSRAPMWSAGLDQIILDIQRRTERQRYGGRLVMTPPIRF
jgi:hypothetical protein